MDRIMQTVGILVLCAIIIFGKNIYAKYKQYAEITNVKENSPSYHLNANDLYSEYSANEVAADEKYKNQIVEVEGIIRNISKDITNRAFIIIGGSSVLDGVHCTFPESENNKIASLKTGQTVKIKGEVIGKTGYVLIDNSIVQNMTN